MNNFSKIIRNDPIRAYNYAYKKQYVYSDEEEQVFLKDPELAVRYATIVKKSSLSKPVEDCMYEFYCNIIKNNKKDQINKLHQLIKYAKMTKHIPSNYVGKLLNHLDSENYYILTNCTEIRLPEKYEKKMFNKIKKTGEVWPLVEYQFALGTKLPEEMHNFMLLKGLEEKSHHDNAIKAYFLNMKKLKNDLIKLSYGFDKKMTIQQIIDEL